jgi:hypothetical protein
VWKVAPALSDEEVADVAAGWLLDADGADPREASADFLRRVQRRLEARREYGQASLVAGLVSAAIAPGGAA